MTSEEFFFAISDTKPLSGEIMQHVKNVSFTQHYEIKSKMRFRLDIESEDKSQNAALLWPEDPFSRVLLLTSPASVEINDQAVFQGRMYPCIQRCEVGGMYLEMMDFIDKIHKKFPDTKDRYDQMPFFVFKIGDSPQGLKAYLKDQKKLVGIFFLSLFLSGGWLLKSALTNRSKN